MGLSRIFARLDSLAAACLLALAFGCSGSSNSGGNVAPPAPTISAFTASPPAIAAGSSSTLSWTVANATSLSIDQGVGAVTGTSRAVSPAATTTYTLTASGAGGSTTATATVTVVPAPVIASFTATPASITAGGSSTLAWSVTGATALSLDQGIGTVTGTSRVVSPTATTTYTLTAANSSGGVTATATRTAVVTVSGPPTFNFGNAPDGVGSYYPNVFGIIHPAQTGSFPTLLAHNGARTQSIADGILGTRAILTPDAVMIVPTGSPADFTDIDGLVNMVVLLTSIPPPAALTVKVTAPTGSAGGTMYLNVLFDKNMNGVWDGAGEWVVQNMAVTLPAPGTSVDLSPPAFAFSNGNILPDPAWMRIALTRERITVPVWDGSGQFSAGEIEDYLVLLPGLPDPSPPPPPWPLPKVKKLAVITVEAGGPYTFPNGVGTINVGFTVKNWAVVPTGGRFDYNLTPINGGVILNQPFNPPPNPLGIPIADFDRTVFPGAPGVLPVTGTATSNQPSDLPSRWLVQAWPVDPPALLFPGGVCLGEDRASSPMDFLGASHTFSTTSESLVHTIGTSPCPTPFPSIVITNTGQVQLTWNATNTMSFVTLDTAGGIIPVGGTATLHPSFPCSGYVLGTQTGVLPFQIVTPGGTPSAGPGAVNFSLTVLP